MSSEAPTIERGYFVAPFYYGNSERVANHSSGTGKGVLVSKAEDRAPEYAGRLHQLDGLRGVAALFVVFEHFLLTQPALFGAFGTHAGWHLDFPIAVKILTYTPLRVMWAGAPAVAIFFILSGLVLSIPAWTGKTQSYLGFTFRRITRLMPIYLLSVGTSAILFAASGPSVRPGTSSWFDLFWIHQITVEGLIRALLFLPGDYLQLNAPLWTLIHEMRISLILPFLVILLGTAPRMTMIAVVIISYGAKFVLVKFHGLPTDLASIVASIAQIWLFCIGALIASALPQITRFLHVRSHTEVWAGFSFLTCALVTQWLLPVPEPISYIPMCIASAGIVSAVAGYPSISTFFSSKVPTFLGKISYPLYAVHFPIFMFIMHVFDFSPFAVMAVTLIITVALSWLLAEYVEPPIIKFGRTVGRYLDANHKLKTRHKSS